jgi:predicted lactoylglutathione lyase
MLNITDFKPYIPSNNFDVSKSFYEAIGFSINWDSSEVCEIDTNAGFRFMLLPQNNNNYAHSLMLHFTVDSAEDCYDELCALDLETQFKGVRVEPPKLESEGHFITSVWDPAGILLQFAEDPDE